jgi:hypothetical protein
MAEDSVAGPRTRTPNPSGDLAVPERLRPLLARWIDLDEIGAAGFWHWLETVLPLLPGKDAGGERWATVVPPAAPRLQELARDLIDCAGDRARLTIACERYYTDNQALSRRVKALEAALAAFERSGPVLRTHSDAESSAIAERYLPR